jgi:hypothetical protein
LWTTNQFDFPFDIIVGGERMTVTSVAGPPANLLTGQNAGFEGGIGLWQLSSNCTVAGTSAEAHSGSSSLQVTSAGSSTFVATLSTPGSIVSQGLPCHAGDLINTSFWALIVSAGLTARAATTFVEFFKADGTFIGPALGGPSTFLSTSAWTFVGGPSIVAPALAALFLVGASIGTAAGAGEVYAVDDAFAGDFSSGQLQQTLTVIRSVNGVVKSHTPGEPVYLFQPVYTAVT